MRIYTWLRQSNLGVRECFHHSHMHANKSYSGGTGGSSTGVRFSKTLTVFDAPCMVDRLRFSRMVTIGTPSDVRWARQRLKALRAEIHTRHVWTTRVHSRRCRDGIYGSLKWTGASWSICVIVVQWSHSLLNNSDAVGALPRVVNGNPHLLSRFTSPLSFFSFISSQEDKIGLRTTGLSTTHFSLFVVKSCSNNPDLRIQILILLTYPTHLALDLPGTSVLFLKSNCIKR